RAYLLKEALAQALDYRQPWRARQALREWLGWAWRSRLPAFVKLARTIRRHREGILAYISERLTNGIVEGINTRLRMVARRAFCFHSPQALIAMLYLCCGGVRLEPRLP
ncbi:ISL3 family transposase, partial [Candidatus Parcubacteria bacterium]